jgi:hypothetical protein
MTTLAKDTRRDSIIGNVNEFPVVASDILYEGSAIGLVDASGHARPLTSVDKFVGFCEQNVDNSAGAAAALNVRVIARGVAKLSVSGALITDVGQPVYATDDNVFVFLPTGGVYIGDIIRFVSSGVVEVEYDAVDGEDPYAGTVYQTLAAATLTLDAQDCGKTIFVTETSVITLPVTATALSNVKLVCMAPFGTAQISADPAAADKVMGPDIAGTNNKDLENTLATARRGDFILLTAGHADGFVVEKIKGTWATETP